jgi:hypothetical protein
MGIVNRYAIGLLDLCDSQTQGDSPSSMGDVIAPTMDISEFLFASKRSVQQGATVTLTALGIASLVTVPAGEMWWLRYVGGEAIARDAIAATIRWAIYATTLTNNFPIATSDNLNQAATGAAVWCKEHLPRPLVLVPGDQLVVQLGVITAATLGYNFNCTWIYDKLSR